MKTTTLLSASITISAALALALAAPARAQEVERQGGRFGASLYGGYASAGTGAGTSTGVGYVGPTIRFGGALTDRFHILGEFHLGLMPGPTLPGYGSATAFYSALDLAGQGYIGPRFFIRVGAGLGWACAVAGNTWILPLPGPRVSGAIGYDVWRRGERSLSVSLEGAYTVLYRDDTLGSLFAFTANVGFDWY